MIRKKSLLILTLQLTNFRSVVAVIFRCLKKAMYILDNTSTIVLIMDISFIIDIQMFNVRSMSSQLIISRYIKHVTCYE